MGKNQIAQRRQHGHNVATDQSIRGEEYPDADRPGEMLEVSRRVIFNDRDLIILVVPPQT